MICEERDGPDQRASPAAGVLGADRVKRSDGLPIPEWHRLLLEERISQHEAHPEEAIPWAEMERDLWRELAKRRESKPPYCTITRTAPDAPSENGSFTWGGVLSG